MIRDWISQFLSEVTLDEQQTDYSHSLEECFEFANSDVYTRSQGTIKNRAYRTFKTGNQISAVAQYLNDYAGLKKFRYVGCGDNAIVMQYSKRQVLRIRGPAIKGKINTQEVRKAPFICPIWKEVELFGGRLNFVPFIPSLSGLIDKGKILEKDGQSITHLLVKKCFEEQPSLWFYDYYKSRYKFEQIGMLDDNTPIIIDQGAVVFEEIAQGDEKDRVKRDRQLPQRNDLRGALRWDGKWTDADGIAKIDLLEKPNEQILNL